MATVRSLYVALKMQTDDYNKKIKAANQEAKEFQRILKPTSQILSDVGKTMVAVGGVVSLALLGMAKKAADYGDQMLEASQKTGISTKQLAAFKLVADQSGSSFEGLTGAVSRLAKTSFEAATKGGEAAKTFQALGISVKDSAGHVRNASDLLPEIADRFAQMKDGTEKTAIAIRLFGKAGADLIPVLNQGSAGFREASRLVEKYNVDIGDAGNQLGNVFNDRLAETSLAMQGLSNQIGKALLPAMTRMVDIGNNVIAMVSKWAKEHPGLTRVVAGTAFAMTGAGGLLIGMSGFMMIAPGMIANLKLIGAAFMGLSVPMRLVVIALTALTAAFLAFPKIRGPVIETLAVINGIVFANIDAFGRLAGILVRFAKGEFTAAWETLKDLPQQMQQSFKDRGDMVRDFAKGIGASVKDMNAALTMKPGEMPDLKGMGVDLDAFGKTTKDTAGQVEQFWKQLTRENSEADALQAVLLRAQAAHIPLVQIQATLGGKIREVTDEFISMGLTVPTIISQYDALMFAEEQLAESHKNLAEKFAKEREEFNKPLEEVAIKNGGMTPALEAMRVQGAFAGRVREATENLQRQRDQVRDLSAQIVVLNRQGMSARNIEHALGMSIEEVTRRAKDLGVQMDPLTKKLGQQEFAARNLRDAWGSTFAAISDRLVDIVADFNFSFKALVDIATSTAKSLLRSFLDGFFKPFKDSLASIGEGFADMLSSALFGGGGGAKSGVSGAVSGALGVGGKTGILGAALSKIPGLGFLGAGAGTAALVGTAAGIPLAGSAAATAALGSSLGLPAALGSITPLAGPGAGAGAGGAVAGGFLSAAAPFLPFAGAVVAGATAILSNQMKDVADRFTPRQTEFDTSFANAPDAGKMRLATDYLSDVYEFAQAGAGFTGVARQALETFKANYGELEKFGVALDLPEWKGLGLQWKTPGSFRDDLMVSPSSGSVTSQGSTGTGGGTTIEVGGIQNTFILDGVTDVPTMIDWIKRNFGGLTEEIVRQVELKTGAVVSR